MADETPSIQRAEQVDHQLVRGIGVPALTANIVSSTIGAGIFVIPATVAAKTGPAAPLAFFAARSQWFCSSPVSPSRAAAFRSPADFTPTSKSRSADTSGFSPACFISTALVRGRRRRKCSRRIRSPLVIAVIGRIRSMRIVVIALVYGVLVAHQHSRCTRRRRRRHDSHARETSPVASVLVRRNIFH